MIAVTPSTVTLQRDKSTLLNGIKSGEPDALTFTPGGFVGHTEGIQRYAYEADPSGHVIKARLKKKARKVSLPCGEWTRDGEGKLVTHKLVAHWAEKSATVVPGRSEHYDFNF